MTKLRTPMSHLLTSLRPRYSGLHVLFQRELEHYEFDENFHDISGNYEATRIFGCLAIRLSR